jgi:hypothetical protein
MARLDQTQVVLVIEKATRGERLSVGEGSLLVEYIVFLELRLKLLQLDNISMELIVNQKNLALYYENLYRTMGKDVADGLFSQAGLVRDGDATTPVAGEFTEDQDTLHFDEDDDEEDEDTLGKG